MKNNNLLMIQRAFKKYGLSHFTIKHDKEVQLKQSATDIERLNQYIESIELESIGDNWHKINYSQAINIMTFIGGYSFFQSEQIIHEQKVKKLISSFFDCFQSKDLQYYTNLKVDDFNNTAEQISRKGFFYSEPLDPTSIISLGVACLGAKETGIFVRHDCD